MSVDVEIVFSGLCSFINVTTGKPNPLLPDPSVILVRTDITLPKNCQPPGAAGHDHHPGDGSAPAEQHTSFLAFDSTQIRVDDASGFVRVPGKVQFWSLTLDGVLLVIVGDTGNKPTVLPTYDDVLKKDKYWPDAQDQYNRDYIPDPLVARANPSKSVVNAFLRFGSGTISAGRLSTVQWRFDIPNKAPHIGYFAEEVVYSGFPHSSGTIVINMLDLGSGNLIRSLTFTARTADVTKLTLFIGNNNQSGIIDALNRKSDPNAQPFDGKHVAFLNAVASPNVRVNGPIPQAVPQPIPKTGSGPVVENPGGGGSDGFCGPGSANG